eukprot:1156531-Pelagomonas_calceolata.AAC.4
MSHQTLPAGGMPKLPLDWSRRRVPAAPSSWRSDRTPPAQPRRLPCAKSLGGWLSAATSGQSAWSPPGKGQGRNGIGSQQPPVVKVHGNFFEKGQGRGVQTFVLRVTPQTRQTPDIFQLRRGISISKWVLHSPQDRWSSNNPMACVIQTAGAILTACVVQKAWLTLAAGARCV